MHPASKANQHIMRISAHLHPPNFQVPPLKLSSSSIVGRACFLISCSLSWWWHGIQCSFSKDGGELGVKACALPGIGAAPGFKVAILGVAGGIGQPLAMLMKINLLISVLHLYDVVNTPGVTTDISHMDTSAVVRGFLGRQQLKEALVGMDLVIIPAGVPRKPGMTKDNLFNINAGIFPLQLKFSRELALMIQRDCWV